MKNQPNFPSSRSKGVLDPNTVWAAEMIKTQVKRLRPMNPKAYCLFVFAATYYDATTANAVIHPMMERACIALGLTMDELVDVAQSVTLEELDHESGQKPDWVIHYDTSGPEVRIESYQPLFVDWVRDHRATLKKDRISINATKTLSRYQLGMKAGLAKAMEIYMAALTPSLFTDFGFSQAPLGFAPYQIWHTDRNGRTKGTKMQHNCQFSHPLLLDRSPAGYAELIQIRELPDEFVANSFSCTLAFKEIRAKFLVEDDAEIIDAIAEINAYGWHTAVVRGSGEQAYVVLTPTKAFHQRIWDMDFHAAGPLLTRWEVENGFIPFDDSEQEGDDPMRYTPALGYHYLYGLRSAKTGEFITVGQTTQPLISRLHQHERAGSNGDANDGILDILTDPDDHLEIVHFATVHHRITSEKEMTLAHAMLAKGHKIRNKILTVRDNNRTVKLDSRFGSPEFIQRNYWAVQEKLDLIREAHEGKEILFMIDKLPEVPGSTTIDAEAVRWLFQTPEFPAGDGISNNADNADYTMLMWEAEERGAYDEIAA